MKDEIGSLGICLLLMIVILIIGSAISWLGRYFFSDKESSENSEKY